MTYNSIPLLCKDYQSLCEDMACLLGLQYNLMVRLVENLNFLFQFLIRVAIRLTLQLLSVLHSMQDGRFPRFDSNGLNQFGSKGVWFVWS
jgi:hypothetical protein